MSDYDKKKYGLRSEKTEEELMEDEKQKQIKLHKERDFKTKEKNKSSFMGDRFSSLFSGSNKKK